MRGKFAITAKSPGGVGHPALHCIIYKCVRLADTPNLNSKLSTLNSAQGSPRPASHYIKCVRSADTPNLLFIISYLLFLHRPYARQPLHSPKTTPPSAENRQTGANKIYFSSSFGSKMFSKIATIAAGTMPEPPNTSRTASGVCARMPVLAPIP